MNLKLTSMATTALLFSLAAAPQALAAPYDPTKGSSFNFSTIINNSIGDQAGTLPVGPFTTAERTLTATFVTDAAYGQTTGTVNITGITGYLGDSSTGTPGQRFFIGQPNLAGPSFGQINLATGRINPNMSFVYNRLNAPYTSFMPWTTTYAGYFGTPTQTLRVDTFDNNGDGGRSIATLTRVPEIDGGMLPRGLMVLSGVFLMLFGRKRAQESL